MLIHFTPSEENHTIDVPAEWYGKDIILEIKESEPKVPLLGDVLPKDLKKYEFLKNVPYDPNFPSIEEIRKEAWPDPWKR